MAQFKESDWLRNEEILLEELAEMNREIFLLEINFESEIGESERTLEWAQVQIQKGYLVESF